MFKWYKLLIVLFLISNASSLGAVEIITSKLLLEDSQKAFNKLEFGVRSDATDTVDTDLGENYDLPGPPPGGLHGYFRIFNPVSNQTTSSYLDFRAIPDIHGQPVVFTLHTFYVVEYLKFKWQMLDRELIDSAFIEDVYGAGIKFDMLEMTNARVDNPSITKYHVSIYYSDKVASLYDASNIDIQIYPNPARDIFTLESQLIGGIYRIYDSQMMMVNKGIIQSEYSEFDLSDHSQGLYYIIIDHYGETYYKKFIIID